MNQCYYQYGEELCGWRTQDVLSYVLGVHYGVTLELPLAYLIPVFLVELEALVQGADGSRVVLEGVEHYLPPQHVR